jgi:hypothetical protein
MALLFARYSGGGPVKPIRTDRERFIEWSGCLLDPSRSPGEHRAAACAWVDWGLARLGVDEASASLSPHPFFAETVLASGKAVSPLAAARCVREQRRTAVFLQAMDAAIRAAFDRFPGAVLHVVEAGCGPLAPLALAFAVRHPANRVRFTLLDLHPEALDAAGKLSELLGVETSIRGRIAADLTTHRFGEDERPHVIACEVMLRALTREPQVCATINLAPQLLPGGIFIPERIDVDAVDFDSGDYFAPAADAKPGDSRGRTEMGTVFSLEGTELSSLRPLGSGRYEAGSVEVPREAQRRPRLHLFTRIRVFGDCRLGDFDSSLNLPVPVKLEGRLAAEGGRAQFFYEVSDDPGLRLMPG